MELIPFLQSVAYLAAICGFIWYLRKDSKDDYNAFNLRTEKILESWRKDSKEDYLRLETKLEAWRNETNQLIMDFHGKLCEIEGKYRQIK